MDLVRVIWAVLEASCLSVAAYGASMALVSFVVITALGPNEEMLPVRVLFAGLFIFGLSILGASYSQEKWFGKYFRGLRLKFKL